MRRGGGGVVRRGGAPERARGATKLGALGENVRGDLVHLQKQVIIIQKTKTKKRFYLNVTSRVTHKYRRVKHTHIKNITTKQILQQNIHI